MDILTYMTEGLGRHADSMGNRGKSRIATYLASFLHCLSSKKTKAN